MDFSRFDDGQLKYFYRLFLSREDDIKHSISREQAKTYKVSDRLIDLQAEEIVVDSLKGLLLSEIALRGMEKD